MHSFVKAFVPFFFLLEPATEYLLIVPCLVLISTLHQHTYNLKRGSVLIQGLIGLYPTQSPEPWFIFVTQMRSAVERNVLFVCGVSFVVVALPPLSHQ